MYTCLPAWPWGLEILYIDRWSQDSGSHVSGAQYILVPSPSLYKILWESEKLMIVSLVASWVHHIQPVSSSPSYYYAATFCLNWSGDTESPIHPQDTPYIILYPCFHNSRSRLPSPISTCLSVSYSSRFSSNAMLHRKQSLTSSWRSPCLFWVTTVLLHSCLSFFLSTRKK